MWKARLCFGSRPHKPKCALDVTAVTVPGGTLLHPQAAVPITAVPPIFSTGAVNRSGLNGLTACGTTGLQTVRTQQAWRLMNTLIRLDDAGKACNAVHYII